MKHLHVTVPNKTGLHARPARLFVKEASKFQSKILIKKQQDQDYVNAKSILTVMALGAGQNTNLEIVADGSDEDQAIECIRELFRLNLME